MKNLFVLILFIIGLSSCDETSTTYSTTDLPQILNSCKGHAIVVAIGYNPGNIKGYKHTMLIKDDSTGITYEFKGSKYYVVKGDTLK